MGNWILAPSGSIELSDQWADRERRKSTHTTGSPHTGGRGGHHVTLDSAAIQVRRVMSRTDPVPCIGTQDCPESQTENFSYTTQDRYKYYSDKKYDILL